MNPLIRSALASVFALAFVASAVAQTPDPKLVLEIPDSEPLTVPLDANQPLTILSTGDLSARTTADFSCATDPGEECPTCPVCDDVQVSMTNANGGSFSVSPSTVARGGNVTFNWSSRGAWSCSGSDLPGSTWNTFVGNPAGPSGSISTTNVEPGNYTVRITCCNGPNCASRTTALNVLAGNGNGPEGCEDRAPPSQMSQATQCLWGTNNQPVPGINCSQWSSVFGATFPSTSSAKQVFLDPGRYLAMQFNTGSYTGSQSGSMQSIAPQYGAPTTFPGGRVITTISRCPGDFNRAAIVAESENACYNDVAPVRWSSQGYNGSVGPANQFCALQPNTTYYYNLVFSNSPAGTAPNSLVWWCSTSATQRCGRLSQIIVN